MTSFEYMYRAVLPFEHPLYQRVNRLLRKLAGPLGSEARILDVGGRRSNYTVGIPGRVWVSDVPRATDLQVRLDLGATDGIVETVRGRRSNIERYLIDDMTRSVLQDDSFDLVVAIEVLEHVQEDRLFVENVRRVLRPGGWFVMTTPNGDDTPLPYPDHKRHYRKHDLRELLAGSLSDVHVRYCVRDDGLFRTGARKWSVRRPLRTLTSMAAFFAAYRLEQIRSVEDRPVGTLHLMASARKQA
jgi:SAM-dependent methyltransferase